jgi:hypothetical protein
VYPLGGRAVAAGLSELDKHPSLYRHREEALRICKWNGWPEQPGLQRRNLGGGGIRGLSFFAGRVQSGEYLFETLKTG